MNLVALAIWSVFCIGLALIAGDRPRRITDASSPFVFAFGVMAVFWCLGVIVYSVFPLVVGWIWT